MTLAEFDTTAFLFEAANVSYVSTGVNMKGEMSSTQSKQQANSNKLEA